MTETAVVDEISPSCSARCQRRLSLTPSIVSTTEASQGILASSEVGKWERRGVLAPNKP
ncbi:hypothetical protein NY486_18775 [Enterobacter hormaechei]|nr:hypothetical protein [Enterobacter hormaechei]